MQGACRGGIPLSCPPPRNSHTHTPPPPPRSEPALTTHHCAIAHLRFQKRISLAQIEAEPPDRSVRSHARCCKPVLLLHKGHSAVSPTLRSLRPNASKLPRSRAPPASSAWEHRRFDVHAYVHPSAGCAQHLVPARTSCCSTRICLDLPGAKMRSPRGSRSRPETRRPATVAGHTRTTTRGTLLAHPASLVARRSVTAPESCSFKKNELSARTCGAQLSHPRRLHPRPLRHPARRRRTRGRPLSPSPDPERSPSSLLTSLQKPHTCPKTRRPNLIQKSCKT